MSGMSHIKIEDLIGSWQLKSHRKHLKNGEVHPSSSYLKGKLIYTTNGKMSVFIILKETVENVNEMIVYSGSYSLQPGKILHHIEISPKPQRVNTTEERFFEFEAPRLILRTPLVDGDFFEIEWMKEA